MIARLFGAWPLALASGPSHGQQPGPFSEQERERLVAGGGGSRRRKRPDDTRHDPAPLVPSWVAVVLILVAAGTYAVTQLAALNNPQANTGYAGPVMLAAISLVAGIQVTFKRKNGDDQ